MTSSVKAWMLLLPSAAALHAADGRFKPAPSYWGIDWRGYMTNSLETISLSPYYVKTNTPFVVRNSFAAYADGTNDNTLRGWQFALCGGASALKSQALVGWNDLDPYHPGGTNAMYDHGGAFGTVGTVTWFNNDTFQSVPGTFGVGVYGGTYGCFDVNIGVGGVAAPMASHQHLIGVSGIALADFDPTGSVYNGAYFEIGAVTSNNPNPVEKITTGIHIDNRDMPSKPFAVFTTTSTAVRPPLAPPPTVRKLVLDGDGSIVMSSMTGQTRWRIQVDDAGMLKITKE